MKLASQLDSTRFFFVQEGLAIAIAGAAAFTIWSGFPYVAMMGFVSPMILGSYWLKTWGHVTEAESGAAVAKAEAAEKKTDLAIAKVEEKKVSDDGVPIR
jgi:hypothetical protein